MDEKARAVLERLTAMLTGLYDPEAGHGEADELLVDLCRALAAGTSAEAEVEAALYTYGRLEKWYA